VEVYKTRWTTRFVRRERISDKSLVEAVQRAERGLIDADLGSGLIKQRVARVGQGRSGGYRMLLAYRAGERAVFIYGFAKNERDNADPDQLSTAREQTTYRLSADERQIEQALAGGGIQEIF